MNYRNLGSNSSSIPEAKDIRLNWNNTIKNIGAIKYG